MGQPLTFKKLPDITPKIIYLIDELKDKLVALGYDEIMSWPLTSHCEEPSDEAIRTQNSINSESIYLRQSIIQSLKQQLAQYQKYKLPQAQFLKLARFIFRKTVSILKKTLWEIYNYDSQKLQSDLNTLNLTTDIIDNNFSEIILDNLPKPNKYIPHNLPSQAIELTSQIITLDANLNLDSPEDPINLIKEYSAKIDSKFYGQCKLLIFIKIAILSGFHITTAMTRPLKKSTSLPSI